MLSSRVVLCLIVVIAVRSTSASVGDRSPYYRACVEKCSTANCTEGGVNFHSSYGAQAQPLYLQLTKWSCHDECCYDCMWKTVEAFSNRNWAIPQFHGKWPFTRILGIQEPASVVFSIFNFIAHCMMLKQFRREVRKTSPMYWLWHAYAMVCLNCWFWSSVFHTRDTPFTEMMDYFSAFSTVLFSFYAMVVRLLNGQSRIMIVILSFLCAGFFVHHVTYLALVNFDYGYNMQANIIVGIANAMGWFIWCFYYRKSQPYVWRCALFVLLVGVCMIFELMDFPPFLWVIDAHSLWHLATAGLPFIFYRFLIDDCKFLRNEFVNNKEKLRPHID
ncbi:post-GPI attachment to proteins factor 3 [Cryptotermes secundus]|uniref:post-GPI attachment to proteins factor 3 n=1 Tax=Cryptotermes secundus TaxID=105785 RepID=UPI000CD7D4B8|nr:post-GPI attachment to proteins factor 3 [Cryptotermes secundus]